MKFQVMSGFQELNKFVNYGSTLCITTFFFFRWIIMVNAFHLFINYHYLFFSGLSSHYIGQPNTWLPDARSRRVAPSVCHACCSGKGKFLRLFIIHISICSLWCLASSGNPPKEMATQKSLHFSLSRHFLFAY